MRNPTPLHSLILAVVAELRRTGILSDLELGNIIETYAGLCEESHHDDTPEYVALLVALSCMIRDEGVSDVVHEILKKLKMGGYKIG